MRKLDFLIAERFCHKQREWRREEAVDKDLHFRRWKCCAFHRTNGQRVD
jgi:hypothetical protein